MSYQPITITVARSKRHGPLVFSLKPAVPAAFNVAAEAVPKAVGRNAGFGSSQKLKKFLHDEIYGPARGMAKALPRLDYQEACSVARRTISACDKIIPLKNPLTLVLFPTANKFTRAKMQGVSGYTPSQRLIFLFISPVSGWQQALARTIAHEYAHTCSFQRHEWRTLGDALIFEGLAEHFRQAAIKGPTAPWSRTISPARAKKIFHDIHSLLHQPDEDWYDKIFLGADSRFPRWSGYTIGYRIVQSFLAQQKKTDWQKIIKLKPAAILAGARY